MSRYYKNYDAYGEPRSILKPAPVPPCPLTPSGEAIAARFEREATACVDAEEVYENLRHQGFGHTEARAIIAERFKV